MWCSMPIEFRKDNTLRKLALKSDLIMCTASYSACCFLAYSISSVPNVLMIPIIAMGVFHVWVILKKWRQPKIKD